MFVTGLGCCASATVVVSSANSQQGGHDQPMVLTPRVPYISAQAVRVVPEYDGCENSYSKLCPRDRAVEVLGLMGRG